MTDWFDRIARLAALGERVTGLTDGVKSLTKKVEDHQSRMSAWKRSSKSRAPTAPCSGSPETRGPIPDLGDVAMMLPYRSSGTRLSASPITVLPSSAWSGCWASCSTSRLFTTNPV